MISGQLELGSAQAEGHRESLFVRCHGNHLVVQHPSSVAEHVFEPGNSRPWSQLAKLIKEKP